jgi:hypothetical protein
VRAYIDALSVIIGDKGQKVRPFGFEGPEVVAVDREDIREEFYSTRPAEGEDEKKKLEARKKAFKRGEDGALKMKLIVTRLLGNKHMAWLPNGDKSDNQTHGGQRDGTTPS